MDLSQEIPVYNFFGEHLSNLKCEFKKSDERFSKENIHQVVKWQLSKRRSGTRGVLTRSFVNGSKKKPWKQKGTGRARAGSSVSPLWVGGGVAHGPTMRSFEVKMPKKMRRLALRDVLQNKLVSKRILIIESFDMVSGKTKDIVSFLVRHSLPFSSLIICSSDRVSLMRASRNIPNLKVLSEAGVNVYDILSKEWIVVEKSVFESFKLSTN
jgi:large subunit ribosomal protein L4